MKFLYLKPITILLFVIVNASSITFSYSQAELKDEDKKQTIEFRIREHLKDANLFEYSKWSSIESIYFAENSKSKRDKIVIEHYYSLYSIEISKLAKNKEIKNAVEFTGILGGLIGAIAIGPVLGAAGVDRVVAQAILGLGLHVFGFGTATWSMLELSPASVGEHGPYSLIKNAVKAGQYARGKAFDDPYVSIEETFVKAYFTLHKYQPHLFEKTKEVVKNMRSDSSEYIHNYAIYVETAASLPAGLYAYQANEEFMYDVFKNYSEQVVDSLDYLSSTYLFWSQNNHLSSNEEHPFYFEGVPGSGKTHAAKNLAEGLGTTMVTVALDGADYDAIVGQKFEPHSSKERGRILEAFSRVKSTDDTPYALNSILFIDEFDRLLNADDYPSRQVLSFMLKALDPTKRSFYSPYLGVEVQLPNLIILAGNYAIEDEALTNRFETVKFDGFGYEGKMAILNESILPKALKSFGLTEGIFSQSDKVELDNIVTNSMNDRGLRSIEKGVNKLLMKKSGQKNIIKAVANR